MISDEMLKKATAEADQAIRDSLPAPAECEHEFSPSFQRKMVTVKAGSGWTDMGQ